VPNYRQQMVSGTGDRVVEHGTKGRRRLFYADNLDVLRENFKDESADLIYLDAPFNSQASYNVLYREPSGQQSK
jgi:16S rRNA G966 N2-methylase RsmD